MATITEIRAGLLTAIDAIPDSSSSAYMLDSPPDQHLQVMGPDSIEYDQAAQRGLDYVNVIIQGFSGSPESQAAQVNLDNWLAPDGATSVKAAIETDRTLGGIVDDCWVRSSSGYREYTFKNGSRMLGAEWTVQVLNT